MEFYENIKKKKKLLYIFVLLWINEYLTEKNIY